MIITGPLYEHPGKKYLHVTLQRTDDTLRTSRNCRVTIDFDTMRSRQVNFNWQQAEAYARRYAALLIEQLTNRLPNETVFESPIPDQHQPKIDIAFTLPERMRGKFGELADDGHINDELSRLFLAAHEKAMNELGTPQQLFAMRTTPGNSNQNDRG